MAELVSVIVPIYNVGEYLPRCVDSLVAQTYPELEILLVDDCSTDNSLQVAQEYAQRYPGKCRLVQRPHNGGLSAARNSGIAAASGQWLTFVDSDDWVTPDYVQTLMETAAAESADVVLSGIYSYYSNDNCHEVSPFGDLTTQSPRGEIVALSRSYACTRLFRKELFVDHGILFPEDIRRAEDMATIIPIMTRAKKIAIVRKPMYYYFQRPASISNQNFDKVDVSFYPKTVKRMTELSAPGFETELEYRAISELMYGMVTIMLRAKYSKKEILAHVDAFCTAHPDWQNNPYLPEMEGGKRIFVKFAGKRQYAALKLLIMAWDLKQKLR